VSPEEERAAAMSALAAADPATQAATLAALSPEQRRELLERWERWAHAGQLPGADDWRIWMILAGRGFGKTRAAAEWVSGFARSHPEARIALVGATLDDVHRVMIGGEGGLQASAREREPTLWKGGVLHFASGAKAFAYSAAAPEKLRGPEHHAGWCDEIAKWREGDSAWDNLMMGLRLGEQPQLVVTTTPRPGALLRRVRSLPGVHETHGRTADNPHLPASFVEAMTAHYAGTRLGRQELDGELLEDVPGALWTRALIERCRVAAAPELVRVVVGVDPPASAEGDACGIVAAGVASDGRGYVLEDASAAGLTPDGWARAVAACAARHEADRVVAEANQGGAMVETVLRTAEAALPVRLVHASRGKSARAEPVAALYERGRVAHVGAFPALEDELCGLVAGGGYEGPGRSPDRADALVWAMDELMLGRRGAASIRGL
jgi:phage terminase large subunit-like protein